MHHQTSCMREDRKTTTDHDVAVAVTFHWSISSFYSTVLVDNLQLTLHPTIVCFTTTTPTRHNLFLKKEGAEDARSDAERKQRKKTTVDVSHRSRHLKPRGRQHLSKEEKALGKKEERSCVYSTVERT